MVPGSLQQQMSADTSPPPTTRAGRSLSLRMRQDSSKMDYLEAGRVHVNWHQTCLDF